jgi:hypothetical protein
VASADRSFSNFVVAEHGWAWVPCELGAPGHVEVEARENPSWLAATTIVHAALRRPDIRQQLCPPRLPNQLQSAGPYTSRPHNALIRLREPTVCRLVEDQQEPVR